MDRYLKLSFDNVKGRNCEHCMLSFSKGEHNLCAALGDRPICPEKGCRKDCPLIDNVRELSVIEVSDDMYRQMMSIKNYLYVDYGVNDYLDLFKTKSREELLEIQRDVNSKLECIRELNGRLYQKSMACRDILEKMK